MSLEAFRDRFCDAFPDLCPHFSIEYGDGVLLVPAQHLLKVACDLRDFGFDRLDMLTCVDRRETLECVCRLYSRTHAVSVTLKYEVDPGDPRVPSLVSVWPASDWHEREAYDLFGVCFVGHPDLRRIVLPHDWEGHPLRKEYVDERMVRRPDYI